MTFVLSPLCNSVMEESCTGLTWLVFDTTKVAVPPLGII